MQSSEFKLSWGLAVSPTQKGLEKISDFMQLGSLKHDFEEWKKSTVIFQWKEKNDW